MSINFDNAIPAAMGIPEHMSSSKSILRKSLLEVLPTEQSVYGPGLNERIRFNISSNSDPISRASLERRRGLRCSIMVMHKNV